MRPTDYLTSNQSTVDFASQTETVVAIHTDASAFEQLRPEWDGLRQSGADQDPFLSCDWFACWWRAFGGRRKLYLVTVRQGGALRAVLPLMLEQTWRHGIPVRRLATIGNDHTPRFDLVRDRNDECIFMAVWNHLITIQSEWDVLDFCRLSADSMMTARFVQCAVDQGVKRSLWARAPTSPWIDVLPSWNDYLNARSSGFRKSIRRKMRRLAALGEVRLETLTDQAALAPGLADGLHIESDGCKGSKRTAIASQPSVAGFYTELANLMASRGQLRLHFLTLNNQRIAFDYSLLSDRCLYSLKAGHSRDHAHLSPGTLLLGLIVQSAHDEGLYGIDLMGDADSFKMQWTDTTRAHHWLHCYSDSLRGRWLHLVKCQLLSGLRNASWPLSRTAPPDDDHAVVLDLHPRTMKVDVVD